MISKYNTILGTIKLIHNSTKTIFLNFAIMNNLKYIAIYEQL
jgi:hypothetical protein